MKPGTHGSIWRAAVARAALVAALASALVPMARAEVLLFAAASTASAVSEVIALYAAGKGERVRASFASSGTLARQIALGAPANVFLSANRRWMDYLDRRRLIVSGSRLDLFGNRLVLIAPKASAIVLAIGPGFALLRALGDGRLAVADPAHVPAGLYARQALTALGVWDAIAPRTARAGDVRGALALVARGEVPAGIVYATDLRVSRRVRLIGTFPPSSHTPITYPAALVAGQDTRAAHRFYVFLMSGAALRVFARHGFAVE